MSSYVEVWGRLGRELRTLEADRMTVGTLESNDLVVEAEGVSRAPRSSSGSATPGSSATSARATGRS